MSTGPGVPSTPGDPAAFLRDWMTLVQTELAGLAGDREVHETWQALAALWANAARMVPHDPPRSAPAVAAFGIGQLAVDERDALLARIDALERRIGDLERAAGEAAGRPSRSESSG